MVKGEDRIKTLFKKKTRKTASRKSGNTASRNAAELHKLTIRLPAELVRVLKHQAIDMKVSLTAIIEQKLKK